MSSHRMRCRCFSCQKEMTIQDYKVCIYCKECSKLCRGCNTGLSSCSSIFCTQCSKGRNERYCKRCCSEPRGGGTFCNTCIKKIRKLTEKTIKETNNYSQVLMKTNDRVSKEEDEYNKGVIGERKTGTYTKKPIDSFISKGVNTTRINKWVKNELELDRLEDDMDRELRLFEEDYTEIKPRDQTLGIGIGQGQGQGQGIGQGQGLGTNNNTHALINTNTRENTIDWFNYDGK